MPAAVPLTEAEIPDSLALAHSVGWKDVAADWRSLHAGARVLGIREEGRLVAQGALGLYGGSGVIAKMIVAPDRQRRGLGDAVLRALTAEAESRGIRVLGLVATPFGRPLYERHGFIPCGEPVVLTGRARLPDAPERLPPVPGADAALRMEARWMACRREGMLRARVREAAASAALEGDAGFALALDQGFQVQVGPVVAAGEDGARRLVASLLGGLDRPVRIDVPGEHPGFAAWLEGLGLNPDRRHTEMVRGATRLPWQVPQRFVLASAAWG